MRRSTIHTRKMAGAFLGATLLTASVAAQACAPAPAFGKRVDIAGESAVIVWDAATHTEHFIRRATFKSNAPDFGFLVPTPTVPTLAAVQPDIFDSLDRLTLPKQEIQERTRYDFNPLIFGGSRSQAAKDITTATATMKGMPHGVDSVRVLSTQQVGGYNATVLEADNAQALSLWLGKHGYAARPSLTDWLKPYVAAHWKLTAFKIAPSVKPTEVYERGTIQLQTQPVRMTFQTERPFYPYREPADQRDAKSMIGGETNRLLRVYFLSTERVNGAIGSDANAPAWPGKTTWTDTLAAQDYDVIGKQLSTPLKDVVLDSQPHINNIVTLPSKLRMTVFEDRSSPRPGTDDVFFAPTKDQSAITPPPIIEYKDTVIPIPADVVALILVGIAGGSVFLWRARPPRPRAVRFQ